MTGVGLPLMLGKTGTMLKNRSHQTAIKHAQKNANLRQTAIENIGKQAGSDQIKLMNRVESGKVATKAMQQNRAKADTRFEKRFSKAEQEARKITEDFTNPKSNINVGHSVQDLLDKVKWKYLSDDDRSLFLSTEPGKAIKRLLDLKGHRNPVHKINRLIEDGNLASKKAKYHSVEDVSKQLRNFTSKGETIGTVHEGLARNLNTNLIDNMGTVFEGNPKMHKYWKDTRAMYSVESQHKKPLKNAVLEHQPRKFFEGKPTEAFLETVKGEGSALQSPHHLDYIMQGLNPEEKNKYIQGLLHELGTKSGDFNFPHAAEGYGKLKEPIRNILENSMNPETQEKFARGNKLLTAHDYEMAQPIKSWGFAKKKIPDITNPYAKTDAKSVDKYIRALESKAGVSSSLGKPPLNAESFLGSTQEAIHSPAIIAKTSLFKEQEPPEDIMPQEVTNEPDWDNMSTEELRAIADEPDWDSLSTDQLREIANS